MSNPKEFQAGIIINEDPLIKESGTLTLSGPVLVFSNDHRTLKMTIYEIKIDFGGTAKRIAYINHPSHPKSTIQTTDFSLFRDPAFKNHDAVARFKKEKTKHHSIFWSTFFVLAFIFLAGFYLFVIEKNIVAGMAVKLIPPEYEIALGDKIYELQYKGNIVDDPILQRELEDLAAPLLEKARAETPYKYELHIIDSDEVNAFALPGGHILILSGLIENADSPEELLGVIAHEIGHVVERHSARQMVYTMGSKIFLAIIGMNGHDLYLDMLDKAQYLTAKSYSRAQEYEADVIGLEYLQAANIQTDGMITFFDKMHEEQEEYLKSGLLKTAITIMSTHPASENRVAKLQQLAEAYKGNLKDIVFDYDGFKDRLRTSLNINDPDPEESENNEVEN